MIDYPWPVPLSLVLIAVVMLTLPGAKPFEVVTGVALTAFLAGMATIIAFAFPPRKNGQ